MLATNFGIRCKMVTKFGSQFLAKPVIVTSLLVIRFKLYLVYASFRLRFTLVSALQLIYASVTLCQQWCLFQYSHSFWVMINVYENVNQIWQKIYDIQQWQWNLQWVSIFTFLPICFVQHGHFSDLLFIPPTSMKLKRGYGAKYVVMQYALRLYSPKMRLCRNLNITFHFLFLVHWI